MRLLTCVATAAASAITLFSSTASAATAAQPRCFPESFMFGTATAAAQVEGAFNEGGRTNSIWDDFCRERPEYVCANVADDFYHRYKSDIQLMVETGLQSFRFSISWSRIMNWDATTRRMKVNPEGVSFYHSVIDELRANNIEPLLTIYHFDLPSELQTQLSPPGWLNAEIQSHYLEFATLVFHEFGHKVNYWTTFNEPLTTIGNGYSLGAHAPGFSGSDTQAYVASTNLLVSHAKAVKIFRDLKSSNVIGFKARIGIVLSSQYYYPLDASNSKDVEAAERALQFDMGWFLEPIVSGDYPAVMREVVGDRLPRFTEEESRLLKGSYDLFMLNHYGSNAVTDCDSPTSNTPCSTLLPGWPADKGVDASHLLPGSSPGKVDSHGNPYCKQFTGFPPGYLAMMKFTHAKDPTVDILLTENGYCGTDEDDEDKMDQLKFFEAFVEQVYLAVVEEKIPIIGYTAWALYDNWEWGSYGPLFGIYAVNFTSQTGSPDFYEAKPTDLARIPRASAKWFQKVATTGCLDGWSDLSNTGKSVGTSSSGVKVGVSVGVVAVVAAVAAVVAAVVMVVQRQRRAGYDSLPRA